MPSVARINFAAFFHIFPGQQELWQLVASVLVLKGLNYDFNEFGAICAQCLAVVNGGDFPAPFQI